MKKIIIHMGYNKSGSTTIQKWLYENEKKLLCDEGVLYPQAGRFKFTHHNFGWATIGERGLNFRKIVAELDDEISSANCQTCVVSTEALSLKPYLSAMHICDAFRSRGMDEKYDVTIFGIVRQQANWLQSEYNQRIEATGLASSFSEFMKIDLSNLNYYDVFSKYKAEMPRARVKVAWFEDLIKDGSNGLIHSVFEAQEHDLEVNFANYPAPEKANPSLEMFVSELKRRLNEVGEVDLGSQVCSAFLKRVEKGRSPRWISPDREVEFLAKFHDQNLRVTEEFGGGIGSGIPPWSPSERPADEVPQVNDPVVEARRFLADVN